MKATKQLKKVLCTGLAGGLIIDLGGSGLTASVQVIFY